MEQELKATCSGNAQLHGMQVITKASIAYIATQVFLFTFTLFHANQCRPAVSQSEGLDQTNNHNQHNKGLRKGEWWCASAVPEGKSLMGKGMLLHQRDDADAERGHS